jgi:hypothetical protein
MDKIISLWDFILHTKCKYCFIEVIIGQIEKKSLTEKNITTLMPEHIFIDHYFMSDETNLGKEMMKSSWN